MNERALFDAALEFEDPDQRRVFVEKSCADDSELLGKVLSLLEAHDQANSFLELPAVNLKRQDHDKTSPPRDIEQTSDFSFHAADGVPGKSAVRASEPDDSDEEQVDLSFLAPSTKPGSIGSLGHYEILQTLGQGGFGIVFKAFDEKLHRLVAIKVMNPQMAATSPPRKRFLREARSVAAIKHENIVQVYSVEEQPLPYMVMEFIDGQTLQGKLDGNGPLEIHEVLYLGRQMAGALAAAHALGIIHRDIKPGNILLEQGAEQKVKITDFGLARAADDASMTRTGLISGTPMYMSPEQALGQKLDHRSDLFSLGSVLYQMACGRAPFRAPTAIAVLRRVVDDTPRPLQEILPEVPDWLAAVIDKLHAKKPEQRFQSARELVDLMARYQNEIQLHGTVTSFTKTEPAEAVAETSKDSALQVELATQTQPATKNKVNKGLIGAIAALIAAAIVSPFLITSKRPQGTESKSVAPTITSSTTTTGWYGWPADAPAPAIAPFNADQAKQHQEAWAKYLNVPVEYINSIGMKFSLIPPGEFMMGSTDEEIEAALPTAGEDKLWQGCIKSEGPQHKVVLTRPIYLGVYEVTQGQYQQIMSANPSSYSATGQWASYVTDIETEDFPVESIGWDKATEFCRRLVEQEKLVTVDNGSGLGLSPELRGAYRLPSEAEWEFACRAGAVTQFHSGNAPADLAQTGWYTNSSNQRTHTVGEKQSNAYGLFDMHGNVWEWVLDAWSSNWYAAEKSHPVVNPLNSPGNSSERMARGGNYSSGSFACRSASRCSEASSYNATLIGLRVASSVDAVRASLKLTGPAIPKSRSMELSDAAPAAETSSPKPQISKAPGWYSWPADAPPPAIAPFNTEQSYQHQEAWAEYLNVPVDYTNSIGMKFRLIPPGEFLMGSTDNEIKDALKEAGEDKHRQECIRSEGPQHKVILTKPIYLGVYEVTQAEYEKVMGSNPSHLAATGAGKALVADMDTSRYPVEMVHWHNAAEFCSKLSQQEELKPFYFSGSGRITPLDGTGYRLPTEAEWEYACRAGTTSKYWNGNIEDDLMRSGWFLINTGGRTHSVGELAKNPFGLYDTQGNVWEWVQDGWKPTFYSEFSEKPAVDPNQPYSSESLQAVRGGSWNDYSSNCRVTNRHSVVPLLSNHFIGFRVSLVVDSVQTRLKGIGR